MNKQPWEFDGEKILDCVRNMLTGGHIKIINSHGMIVFEDQSRTNSNNYGIINIKNGIGLVDMDWEDDIDLAKKLGGRPLTGEEIASRPVLIYKATKASEKQRRVGLAVVPQSEIDG